MTRLLLITIFVCTGCGGAELLLPAAWMIQDNLGSNREGPEDKKTAQPEPPAVPVSQSIEAYGVPVETFVVTKVPKVIKASSLTVYFRTNVAGGSFDCRLSQTGAFSPCQGDRYNMTGLRHGQSYMLQVRARSQQGAVDLTPITIEFSVDNISGSELTRGVVTVPAVRPQSLPSPESGNGGSILRATDRSVPVGSFHSIVVPFGMVVSTYSTDKTYNTTLRILRLQNKNGGSAYFNYRCEHSWDRIVPGPDGLSYCDSTPNADQFAAYFSQRLPRNHVELVRGLGTYTDEKVFVATFDGTEDATHIGIEETCRTSNHAGSNQIEWLTDFYGEKRSDRFDWCQVRNVRGEHWWVGTAETSGSRTRSRDRVESPRIRVIFALSAKRGIRSGRQFASYVGELLTRMIVPLAPRNAID